MNLRKKKKDCDYDYDLKKKNEITIMCHNYKHVRRHMSHTHPSLR